MSTNQPNELSTSPNDGSPKTETQDDLTSVQQIIDPFESLMPSQQQQQQMSFPSGSYDSMQQQQQLQTQPDQWTDDLSQTLPISQTTDQYQRQLPPNPPQSLNMFNLNQGFMNTFFPAQTSSYVYGTEEEQQSLPNPENLTEDEITVEETTAIVESNDAKKMEGTISEKKTPQSAEILEITITPEYKIDKFNYNFLF
jgi:membrane-associated HD superfamily phosphohydrolase